MMNSPDTILEEYRNADFNRRLHMYLQFPPLRPRFMSIDQSEQNDKMPVKNCGHRRSRTAFGALLLGFPAGWIKRLIGVVLA